MDFGLWALALGLLLPLGAAPFDTPHLALSLSNQQLTLAWPAAAAGWALEQSPGLDPSVPWTPVSLTQYQLTPATITAALPAPTGNLFYRLRQPSPAVPGLTAAWNLDEGQGLTSQDSTGAASPVSLDNVVWASGRIGPGSLAFNGQPFVAGGSLASISNSNFRLLPPTGLPFSASLWFNPDALSTGWSGLLGNDANGTNGWNIALHNSGPGTNELVFAATGPGASLALAGRTLLIPGRWHELTATYDGTQAVLYLDAEPLASGAGTLLANADPIYFGGGVGGFDSFAGRIDELRLYTNALSPEDISLTGHWQFDENAGPFAADSSLYARPATISDPAAWVPGKDGSGLSLSNSTALIYNAWSEVLPPTGGPFSISFWLNPASLTGGWSGLMSCADGANTGWQLALYAAPGDTRLRFSSTDSGGTLDLSAPVTLAEGTWSKVDLTYNGGIATLYLNGRKIRSDSGGIQGCTAPLVVGSVPGLPNFNGLLDDLKIYSRERDEAEVGPVAKVMWETVFLNSITNLPLQGFGPAGKPLTYTIVNTITPTNGTVAILPGSASATYIAGPNKGPDAFTYTVSDGEFTTPPATVVVSLVQPHWLSPAGGSVPVLDGTTPDQAWPAATPDALDAIWKTNNYYDAFFYAPGEYQTTGWRYSTRGTANPGCKHIGSGRDGPGQTTIKLVNTWDVASEGLIFGMVVVGAYGNGFEVRDMLLDCNAENNPKYAVGEPVLLHIPLAATGRVDSVTLRWSSSYISGNALWSLGPGQTFSVCSRVAGTTDYVTNCASLTSTGAVDTVAIGTNTDELIVRLETRQAGVDFYALSDISVAGASVSLATATNSAGGVSQLNPSSSTYSILHAVDSDQSTVWASGPEDQVRIVLPLQPGTTVNQLAFSWYCHLATGLGRFGPAAEYQIQARDLVSGASYDVPFVRGTQSPTGLEIDAFGSAQLPTNIVTDQLVILLTARELGVDFYSLREVTPQQNGNPVALRLPTCSNTLGWGINYHILRAFDADPATQWAGGLQGTIGALSVVGDNLKFTGLKVIGFGTKAVIECFALSVFTPPAWVTPRRFGNILIEDCVFTQPATHNRDGLTTVGLLGLTPHALTNAVIRRCSVDGMKFHFPISHAFSGVGIENCVASDCSEAVYFEPDTGLGDSAGPVLIRSNRFVNVNFGVRLLFHAGAQFDSVTCLDNEILLAGAGGWGIAACDTCAAGLSGVITNLTALNNIIRYPNWALQPSKNDGGLQASDIHHAVFGNNLVTLGTPYGVMVRPCPAGIIPGPFQPETCDSPGPPVQPPPTYPPCLDPLPDGYRRAWHNNRDLQGSLLGVRYYSTNGQTFASQQQWP